jgi:hypothetical protein
MSDGYRQLLDATIQHLEGLKSRGVRHVAVAPETCVRWRSRRREFSNSEFQNSECKSFPTPSA